MTKNEAALAKSWVATRHAAPTTALELREVEVREPAPGEVRIRTEAFCLDFNDIDSIYGRWVFRAEPPFVPGMLAAGTVESVGPGADHLLGARVVGCTANGQGGYASTALLTTRTIQLIPSWLTAADAAAMYFPYLLSWLALKERARTAAGDVVLIHAAAGGIGSGAVQLAKAFGATVIATAGSAEKLELARELGADYAVNYVQDDFVAQVLDVTNGRGVDVAFDTVGGQTTLDTFRVMAFNGRHLIIGYSADAAAEKAGVNLQPSIYGNFDICGVCFMAVEDPRPSRAFGMNFMSTAKCIEIWNSTLQLVRKGVVRPVVSRTIELPEVPEWLEAMENRRTTGRTVVAL
ncbi:NADPH2:quinone reductase [Parafrankia irregularis]|uniref:NADPH2:quinone reductase n=1 Tax=Parafrankia irregularis TaxID=795642 RepID=A0A0S4QHU3_9ACTN|nr:MULTISPECIES: zinc-binding dehydrogenase [Parafrankia]MBE3204067.1 zinc-binding dehydrogenase [Parafrankia sp. CH37]CUU55057.1 NADPH2:quinone reductase [Parafrankia irregularis]